MTLLSILALSAALFTSCAVFCYERSLFTTDAGFAGLFMVLAVFVAGWFLPTALAALAALVWG